ncbi:hypothetical protein ACFQ0M_32865 [Kitasatospora aburaviensis]
MGEVQPAPEAISTRASSTTRSGPPARYAVSYSPIPTASGGRGPSCSASVSAVAAVRTSRMQESTAAAQAGIRKSNHMGLL